MSDSLLGSVSSIPQQRVPQIPLDTRRTDGMWGGEAEPNKSMSRELLLAVMGAHRAWARRYAPHLLEEWLA